MKAGVSWRPAALEKIQCILASLTRTILQLTSPQQQSSNVWISATGCAIHHEWLAAFKHCKAEFYRL
jgi:hypothetical protein